MKKLEVIIPDKASNEVNNILAQAHVGGVSHYRIDGRGRNTSIFIPETKVEVVVKDEQVETLISAIVEKLSANKMIGKIFVVDIPIAVDIATKKKGESVI
ncbi:MAG: P-II family nitrogen regulator [Nitrososphaeraceae archaeon]|jgi:nitrogen regulatory protein P-II 1